MIIAINVISGICESNIYFMIVSAPFPSWPNFLLKGIVNIAFQSAGTGKYVMPTGYLNTFSGKQRTFPIW